MSRIYVERFITGELASNCYILSNDHCDQAIVIDPGASSDEVTEWFSMHQKTCSAILLTHGHFDHVGGVLELVLNWHCPFYLHPADAFLLERAEQTAEHFLGVATDPVPTNFVPLADQQQLSFGSSNPIDSPDSSITLRVICTPGHTPGSCSFLLEPTAEWEIFYGITSVDQSQVLFSGDTWFPEEPTDVSHYYSRPADLKLSMNSLKHISRLKPTLICPGHGEPVML